MRSQKIFRSKVIPALVFFFPQFLIAQSDTNQISLIAILIIIGALILVAAILTVSENLLQIEAKKYNIDGRTKNISLFPRLSELFRKPEPDYTNGQKVTNLNKGYNINLTGKPTSDIYIKPVSTYAVRPPNFRGIAPIPKLTIALKDEVLAGDVLFYDKSNPDIKYCSPVSGEIVEIRRGAKRSITDVIILADKKQKYKKFKTPNIAKVKRETIVNLMMESGLWALMNERPYDIFPNPEKIPVNIFISTFDTAPYAPDSSIIIDGNEAAFQKGIDVLSKLTSGSVHLGLNANGQSAPADAFVNAKNAETHWFSGKHPAGNVGIQIHHIAPIKTGHSVWTLSLQHTIALGKLFLEGKYDVSRIISIGGSKTENPAHFNTVLGANVGDLLGGTNEDGLRIISGDIFTGRKVSKKDFLDASVDQISVIEEGDTFELFGWFLPIKPRPSISKTFPNFLFPKFNFEANTNTHGEKRAFVVTGEYEKVLPMDIYPQHLLKAILANDFEQMEGLGIYELSEEDLALCEFVCTSKMPLQSILREGLDMMREQG